MEGLSDQLLRVPLPLHQRHPPRRVAERAGHGPDEAVLPSRAPNMAQAMAETINYVNRSRAFMPPGTVSPFVMRFDTGSVPVGYLVLSSETRTHRRDPGPGPVHGPADVRRPAGRLGPAAVRRQRAVGRRHASIPTGCSRTACRPTKSSRPLTQGQHDQPLGQHADRRQVSRSCRSTRWSKTPADADAFRSARARARSTSATSATSTDAADAPDRLRPGQRPPRRLHPGDEAGRRLDAERHQRRSRRPCPRCRRCCRRRHQRQLRVRPVAVRHPRRRRRGHRRAARRGPRRADGAALPARLAERAGRRAEHSAGPDGGRRRPCGSPARRST